MVEIAIGLNLGQNLGRETEVLGPSLSGWVRDGAPGAVRASFTIVLGHVAGCSSWRTGNLCGKALTWAQFRNLGRACGMRVLLLQTVCGMQLENWKSVPRCVRYTVRSSFFCSPLSWSWTSDIEQGKTVLELEHAVLEGENVGPLGHQLPWALAVEECGRSRGPTTLPRAQAGLGMLVQDQQDLSCFELLTSYWSGTHQRMGNNHCSTICSCMMIMMHVLYYTCTEKLQSALLLLHAAVLKSCD